MSAADTEGLWRGTSDAPAALRARAASTPAARLAWLEDSLLLAEATGALALDRAQRQRSADRWAAEVGEPHGIAEPSR